jgi:hypothetical protein
MMRDVEFVQQLLDRRYLVGLLADLEMRQQQVGTGVECVQHLRRFAVGEVIEAALEGLAIKGEDAQPGLGAPGLQAGSMPAEHMFDRSWIKALENVADGGMSWRTFPVQTKSRVQVGAVDTDERYDTPKRICPGHHGKD